MFVDIILLNDNLDAKTHATNKQVNKIENQMNRYKADAVLFPHMDALYVIKVGSCDIWSEILIAKLV